MKKEFKLVSASVIGLVCASLMTPSFAVTAVRSLGGAGTYTGTTSAAQSATTARAGSVRVGGSTRTSATSSAALRTPSTRSATAPRLSIGKYLSTNSSLGTGGKVELSNTVNSSVNELNTKYDELEQNIDNVKNDLKEEIVVNVDGLREELQTYAKDFTVDYVDGVLIITRDGEEPQEIPLFDKQGAEDKINQMIADAIDGIDIPEFEGYENGNMIEITTDEQGKKSVNANVIVGALTGKLEADKLVTANQTVDYVTGYAIPKPGAGQCNTKSSTCVLSVKNNGELYWLELVDAEPASDEPQP